MLLISTIVIGFILISIVDEYVYLIIIALIDRNNQFICINI